MEDTLQHFKDKGWAQVPGFLDATDFADLLRSVEALEAPTNQMVGTDKSKARTGLMLKDAKNAKTVVAVTQHPLIQSIFRAFYTKPMVDHTKVLVKAAGGVDTPWHQDASFWLDRDPEQSMFTVWIALKPVTIQNGCMRVIDWHPAAGEAARLYDHEVVHEGNEKSIPAAEIDVLTKDHAIIDCEMRPGDALLFRSQIIHMAYPNQSDGERMACKVVFQDLAKRGGGTRHPARTVALTGLSGSLNLALNCLPARFKIATESLRTRLRL